MSKFKLSNKVSSKLSPTVITDLIKVIVCLAFYITYKVNNNNKKSCISSRLHEWHDS